MTDQPHSSAGDERLTRHGPILLLADAPAADTTPRDPADLLLTCANCGAPMDERKCKLICACGYFLSCSDYL